MPILREIKMIEEMQILKDQILDLLFENYIHNKKLEILLNNN